MGTVLHTSPLFEPEGAGADLLRDAGHTIVTRRYHPGRTEPELVALMEEVQPVGVIAGLDPFTEEVIAAGARHGLRVIARTGVGYDTIDLAAATAHGVVVTTTVGSNTDAVADLTFALLLALARRIPYHDRLVRQGQGWTRVYGPELSGKTLGIVGLGMIGRAVARRAAGFGMRLVATDLAPDAGYAAAQDITYLALDDLLGQSDVVTLHVTLNPTSQGLIGARELGLMKPAALLLNTSRGGVVDEAALCRALAMGSIAGAGLDVFEREPPLGSPLLALENVVLTPHCAGTSRESVPRAALMAAQSVAAVLAGQQPPSSVNPQVAG